MEGEPKPLILLELLFGQSAPLAQREASPRLLLWCRAFEEWLADRKRIYRPNTIRQTVPIWRHLVQQSGKTPYELTEADIEIHIGWMQSKGYAPSTICYALVIFNNFYRWCGERGVDPQCPEDFNPAKKVRRPQVKRCHGAKLLSREETERLLNTIRRDPSELGKRDYAFFLARLSTGVPLKSLQELKWGQIEQDAEGSWVRWQPGEERQPLPNEVWEAIKEALQASGRLAWINPSQYVFAPLAEPGKAETRSKAEDWLAEKHLKNGQLLASLKLYGRLARIKEEGLNLLALRQTAIRLRLDEGASLDQMRLFTGYREESKVTKYRLGKLPQLPPDEARPDTGGEIDVEVPDRKAKHFQPGDGVVHGFYRRSQPPEQVRELLKENLQGIDEQIESLRILERLLVERQAQARSGQEVAQLVDASMLAASRIGELVRAEKELKVSGTSSNWAEEFLARLDRFAIEKNRKPVSDQIRKEALGGDLHLEAAARRLVEEVAAVRYALRNVFRLGMEAQNTADLVRLVGIYGDGCVRLVRLLKIEKTNTGQLEAYLKEGVDQALVRVVKDLGLVRMGG